MENKQITKTFLEIRERIYDNFVSYEKYLKYLLRLVLMLILFSVITKQFNYHEKLSGNFCVMGLALLSSVLPNGLVVILAAALTVGEIYFYSPILAVVVAISCILVYFMATVYDRETVWAVAFLPIMFLCKIPAVFAFVLGLFFGPVSALSLAGGACIYYVLKNIKETSVDVNVAGADLLASLRMLIDEIFTNPSMYVMMFALSATLILVYLVRTMRMKYSFEIAIVFGVVCYCILLLMGNSMFMCDFSTTEVVTDAILSGLLAWFIHCCHMVLDYGSVEEVQFEDEDYYYYVKAVPKLKGSKGQKTMKNAGNVSERTRLSTGRTGTATRTKDENTSESRTAVASKSGSTVAGRNASTTLGKSASTVAGKSTSTLVGKSASTVVGKSTSTTLGKGASTTLGNSGSTTLGNSGSTTLGKNRSTALGNSASTTLGKSRSTTLGKSESTTLNKSGNNTGSKNGSTTVIRNGSTANNKLGGKPNSVPNSTINTKSSVARKRTKK